MVADVGCGDDDAEADEEGDALPSLAALGAEIAILWAMKVDTG